MGFTRYYPIVLIIVLISIIIIFLVVEKHLYYFTQGNNQTNDNTIKDFISKSDKAEVLLLYVYANTHSHAYGNLKYFIDVAVRKDDGVDYYFILQRVDNTTKDESKMPLLPENGHYIQHDNECYDLGTVGWFIDQYTFGNPWIDEIKTNKRTKKIDLNMYKYFIFLNSSIRGPFFPPYFLKFLSDYQNEFNKRLYWYHIFTTRLNLKVRLVGPTINCNPVPHVQSYVLVTDSTGLALMLKPGSEGASASQGIFGCYATEYDGSLYGELPTSNRIRDLGYMLDSLLTKYQGIDFNKNHNHQCNNMANPQIDASLDGTSLEPYEVVFVKYTDAEFLQVSRNRAKLYERWNQDTKITDRSIW